MKRLQEQMETRKDNLINTVTNYNTEPLFILITTPQTLDKEVRPRQLKEGQDDTSCFSVQYYFNYIMRSLAIRIIVIKKQ